MTYTVVWSPSAQNDLATLWMNASDKNAVADASNAIDALLRHNPYANSESRAGSDRIMFVHPLGVIFQVSEDDRQVAVSAVWRADSIRNGR